MPFWVIRVIGVLRRFDEPHVGAVEGGVVVGVEAGPLGTHRVVSGAQVLGHLWIVDDVADLVADELGRGVVGGLVEQDVAVGADERHQAARRPSLSGKWPCAPLH